METVKGPDSKEERIERMVSLYQLPLLRLCILYLHDEELAKEAVRAENKSEGMVFVPTWMILYQDASAARQNYSCYAMINAMDGTLIDASFQ